MLWQRCLQPDRRLAVPSSPPGFARPASPGGRWGSDASASSSPRPLPAHSPTSLVHVSPPPILFERPDAPMDGAAASPEGRSQWTARATSLLESVKVLPAQGNDLKLLVRELRNVLNCHETFTQEHAVSSLPDRCESFLWLPALSSETPIDRGFVATKATRVSVCGIIQSVWHN